MRSITAMTAMRLSPKTFDQGRFYTEEEENRGARVTVVAPRTGPAVEAMVEAASPPR